MLARAEAPSTTTTREPPPGGFRCDFPQPRDAEGRRAPERASTGGAETSHSNVRPMRPGDLPLGGGGFKHVGAVEVITGSMFSGKTEELIRRLKRALLARQRVQA